MSIDSGVLGGLGLALPIPSPHVPVNFVSRSLGDLGRALCTAKCVPRSPQADSKRTRSEKMFGVKAGCRSPTEHHDASVEGFGVRVWCRTPCFERVRYRPSACMHFSMSVSQETDPATAKKVYKAYCGARAVAEKDRSKVRCNGVGSLTS